MDVRSQSPDKGALDRRQVLKRIALLVGGTVSAPVLSAGLAGCARSSITAGRKLESLDSHQAELVATIAELIIPKTDTPGAGDAGVTEFIDVMLTEWFPANEREEFLEELGRLEENSRGEFGATFLQLKQQQQIAYLVPLDEQAAKPSKSPFDGPKPFFGRLKEIVLVGYYTSDVGLHFEPNPMAVPGRYIACVPVDQIVRRST